MDDRAVENHTTTEPCDVLICHGIKQSRPDTRGDRGRKARRAMVEIPQPTGDISPRHGVGGN
ncbi:hypothetical protein GCM10029978_080050 [Actinoallomurus acanthiterrae]